MSDQNFILSHDFIRLNFNSCVMIETSVFPLLHVIQKTLTYYDINVLTQKTLNFA